MPAPQEFTYEEAEAAPLEDKFAELDAQLRSISQVATSIAHQCTELEGVFVALARRRKN